MTEFFGQLGSLYWWLSVVVVGVIINLVSAWLKPRLDAFGSGISSQWRRSSERQAAARAAQIESLRSDARYLALSIAKEARHRAKAIIHMVVGLVALLGHLLAKLDGPIDDASLPVRLTTAIFVLLFFFASQEYLAANRIASVLEAAGEQPS